MSDDSSDLSSAPSEDESNLQLQKKDGILKFFSKIDPTKKAALPRDSPPPPEREPSPDHEYVLADNPDIAFIVMFRSRFAAAFPKNLANFGPQELERGVVDALPAEHVENLLCALLGLLLNRKQDVKRGHYNRALEEAVSSHKAQWAKDWEDKSPLAGGATFANMIPTQRLTLLRTLILWSLSSSDVIRGIIATSYKQNRHEDDLNQPLSVQAWGSDRYKRRYFLVEGLDDTNFRIYRESNPAALERRTWWSVAGDIEELKVLAEKLAKEDGGQKARTLSTKMLQAIPRFEATEEKRKRREYRQIRKQQFQRPEPGFSNYEGRTRGKRMKYTYSDDEDEGYSDNTTYTRRSVRNTGTHTPAEGPTVTQSGRQVRSRHGGAYGESILSGAHPPVSRGVSYDADEGEAVAGSRPRRAAAANGQNGRLSQGGRHIEGYNSVDEMDDEEDASEQDYGDDEEDGEVSLESELEDADDLSDDDDELMGDDLLGSNQERKSLVIKLPIKTPTPEKKSAVNPNHIPDNASAKVAEPLSIEITGMLEHRPSTPTGIKATEFGAVPVTVVSSSANSINPVLTTELMDITQESNSHSSFTPLSPALAYRGSPDKTHGFATGINVANGDQ